MLVSRLLGLMMGLFFTMFLESLASESQLIIDRRLKSITNLNWTIRLFQPKNQLPFGLGPNYTQLLASLDSCNSKSGAEKCINKATNRLFVNLMESNSKPDKKRALQATDPFINNAVVDNLIDPTLNKVKESPEFTESSRPKEQTKSSYPDGFKSLLNAMDLLCIGKTKAMDKDCANAKTLLKTQYNLTEISTVDSSIWFLLTLLEFHKNFFKKFEQTTVYIAKIIEHKVILRADVDIEGLFDSMKNGKLGKNWVYFWYGYIIEKSPFKGVKLYDTKVYWKSISELLLLGDPKCAAEILGTNLHAHYHGVRSYLLLLQDNPVKRLTRLKPSEIEKMYSCFVLGSSIGLTSDHLGYFREIPKEKLSEMVNYLVEIKGNMGLSIFDGQLEFPYLNLVSMIGKNGTIFKIKYVRKFTQIPKTLELLDVAGEANMELPWVNLKSFSQYLLENPNWDDALEKHFHYLVSKSMMDCHEKMTESLLKYFGADSRDALLVFSLWHLECIDCTLDKIPRQLNDYVEIIDEQADKEATSALDRLEIAIRGSVINDETVDIGYKQDFVYYQLKGLRLRNIYLNYPIFVNLAYMQDKYPSHDSSKIGSFLHFSHLVHSRFPSLPQTSLEKGFQKLLIKDSFSIALYNFILENFKDLMLPFAIVNLQSLEKELLKSFPAAIMDLQIKEVSTMALLKTICLALGDPCPNLKFAFMKHLVHVCCLHG